MSTAITKTDATTKSLARPTRFTAGDSKALKVLEAQAGGRDGLARMLLFLPAPTTAQTDLLALLESGDARPLTALLKEVGLTPAALASSVVTAKMEFEREVAKASAVEAMPEVVEDLRRHALDGPRRCPRFCYKPTTGIKTVVKLGTEEAICPECDGTGQTIQSSQHKQWAANYLGKISKLPEDTGPGVQVNVQNNVGVKVGTSSLISDLAKAVHTASMVRKLDPEVVEATVVRAED